MSWVRKSVGWVEKRLAFRDWMMAGMEKISAAKESGEICENVQMVWVRHSKTLSDHAHK